jgi:hypothetical protein
VQLQRPPAPAAGLTASRSAARRTLGRGRRLDGYELALLTLFGMLSLWVVALDLEHAISAGLVWTGTDGFFIVDQMQYLAWIQSVAHHGLVENLFVLRASPADYFQPAVMISGLITRLGVAPWLALLLWKPVAVVGLFLAMRSLADRLIEGVWARRAALTLGILFGSFSVIYGSFGIVGDMMPDWLSWGYPFGLMAVALIVFGAVRYAQARDAGQLRWLPGILGGLASTLHPWQGETFVLLILFAEAVRWRDLRLWWRMRQWRRLSLPALTLVLTGVPLLYYLVLGRLDINWGLARDASKHAFSFGSILLGVAPLLAVALLGYRGRSRNFLELVMRVWFPVAIAIYILSATGLSATPLHAFNGITLPLAVLAVLGVQRSGLTRRRIGRWAAVAAMAAGVIPANAYALSIAHNYVSPTSGNANFITKDERAALSYLSRDRTPGGVLTQFYLGEVVPARTGRRTFVGDCLWSEPNCMPRSTTADAVFEGTLGRARARQFVRATGARFVLASCAPRVNLAKELRPLVESVHRFGCAAVIELTPSSSTTSPLAQSAS